MQAILQTKLDIFTDFCAYSQRREHFEFTSDMIINVTFNLPYTTYIQSPFFSTSPPSRASNYGFFSSDPTHQSIIFCRWSLFLNVFHLYGCIPEGQNECLCLCLCVCVCVCVCSLHPSHRIWAKGSGVWITPTTGAPGWQKTWLRQREESWDVRLDETGSDGGSWPGVCVWVCKGGDGGFRVGSGKAKERGCCHSSLKVSAIICFVDVCVALHCELCLYMRVARVCLCACVCAAPSLTCGMSRGETPAD